MNKALSFFLLILSYIRYIVKFFGIIIFLVLYPSILFAASTPSDIVNQQLIYQQERQKALEEQLIPEQPDIRLLPTLASGDLLNFPVESPCFFIQRVNLQGIDGLPGWLRLKYIAADAQGYCLGAQGINILMRRLQNKLIKHGFITSRVLAPEQDLTGGELQLFVLPGKIRTLYLTPDSDTYISLFNTLPLRPNSLLDLRDIEQGLENLQRIPGASAEINIIPTASPGESDVEVAWHQSRFWRIAGSFDDSGAISTGRYQGGLTLFVDNPLSLADTFYLSGGRDLQGQSSRSSKNYTVYYALPLGYWNVSMTASGNDYDQTVAGTYLNSHYHGRSQNYHLRLSRIIFRNDAGKTSLYSTIGTRSSRNYINDAELDIQRRKTSSVRLGLQHRHYFADNILDVDASYMWGTRWFKAKPAPEEATGDATALSRVINLSASASFPFSVLGQRFRYSPGYQQQFSKNALTPQDRLSIGGRWSVRGFDGELNLSADNGWFIRNDLAWETPLNGQALYIGIDYGEVSGKHSQYLPGKHLAGGVIGWQGGVNIAGLSLSYDTFAGTPFSKPPGFKTSPVTLGFTVNWQY